jgi:cysteine desulfurase
MIFSKEQPIYLDYAATTPVSTRVAAAMAPYFSEKFGNPSSLHKKGQDAQAALDEARATVAELLGVSWKEVFFTASATESLNTVLRGVAVSARERGITTPHIITTNIEHSAVLETCRELEKYGVEITYLPVNSKGLISAEQVKDALKENTVLVSVMLVNNEIGTIQPIAEIAEVLKGTNTLLHTDAVQAVNYLDIRPATLGVDIMTLSGHKMYGPKGVGLLYKKESVAIAPLLTGGGQERGLRGGTENVPAIVGFAEALKETTELREAETARVRALRDSFFAGVEHSAGISINGSREQRVANNINISLEGVAADMALPWLDARGIYASSGSACAARVPEPSHVIVALGKEDRATSSIRFTLGRSTTKRDSERAVDAVVELRNKHS